MSSCLACYLRSLIPLVETGGLTERSFLERLGLEGDALSEADAVIPGRAVARAWELAAQISRRPSVGLHAALQLPLGCLPALDHLAANLPTVGEALRAIARCGRLCDPQITMSFETTWTGGTLTLGFSADPSGHSRHRAEWFVGFVVARVRALGRNPAACPVAVAFQHGPPGDLAALETALGCAPTFYRPSTSVSFSHAVLARPIPQASPFLARILAAQAERDLDSLAPLPRFSDHIRRTVRELLEREVPRLENVARRLGCSARTVQGRLQREQTSYQRLLDEVRRDLAIQYAQDDSVRLLEIPSLLRFAEPSPFHRAFRRWTGSTPLEYRRQCAAAVHEDVAGALRPGQDDRRWAGAPNGTSPALKG